MNNTTLLRQSTFGSALWSFACRVGNALFPSKGTNKDALIRRIWNGGKYLWENLTLKSPQSHPRCSPIDVSKVREDHPYLIGGELHKNNGECFAICKCLHAQLFRNTFLLSHRYTVEGFFNNVLEANDLWRHMLRGSLSDFGYKEFLPNPNVCRNPHAYFKSKVHMGEYKIRPFVSHFRHHARKLASLISLALCVLVKDFASCDNNVEFYEMQQAKSYLVDVEQTMLSDSFACKSLGLDLEDMYLNINKDEVFTYFETMIDSTSMERGKHKQYRRTQGVALNKHMKYHDRLGFGPTNYYINISLFAIKHYVEWEVSHNCYFLFASHLFKQHVGIPMGDKLSGQIASMVLMAEESSFTKLSLFNSPFMRVKRYKDNIYIFGRACMLWWLIAPPILLFTDLYAMPVQFEQMGSSISILEVVVSCTINKLSIGLRENNERAWPHYWSPNAYSTLRSLVPRLVHKCRWWSNGDVDFKCNIYSCRHKLQQKYPCNWWKGKFDVKFTSLVN